MITIFVFHIFLTAFVQARLSRFSLVGFWFARNPQFLRKIIKINKIYKFFMIRRFFTMTEAVDVKAGISNLLNRIENATKSRPKQVVL